MLEVDALAFGFPDRVVGRDVTFKLARGEAMCVLGPNGGGKTTLFRTLLGLLEKHSGHIQLDGRDLSSLSRADIARRIGYVPQGHAAYFAYSVREMVLMGRTAHLGALATPGRRDREVAQGALEALGIAHLADKAVTDISGGERQLAIVARALAQDPGLLVMDEPTANLDFGNQVKVLEQVGRLRQRNISILFSSHDPDHAFLAADRALLLGEGRALEIGPPREVIRRDSLQRLYGVDVQVIAMEAGRHVCLPTLKHL
ncbi:MAG TPA: ABC transporter ATP-binding protein [Burkholderiales bacterium]|nr:ABC transporter ATP-binding protein [Burkholderiales bacterium]